MGGCDGSEGVRVGRGWCDYIRGRGGGWGRGGGVGKRRADGRGRG
jgi:hypothetical protein